MKPLTILTVGYITGIIWGLYLKISIVPILFLCLGGIILLTQIENKLGPRLKRKLQHKWCLALAIIFALISNIQIIKLENKFDKLYQGLDEINVIRSNHK